MCGKPIISGEVCNCPFCGAHIKYISEYQGQSAKWRCTVCNHLFDEVPDICPICSASPDKFVKNTDETDSFDLELKEIDVKNAQKALDVEVSNSTFYFCAAEKSDRQSERKLFLALGDVEYQHAVIWQNILKLKEMPKSDDKCSVSSLGNLEESHRREDFAIKFYAEAAETSENARMKSLFIALVEIETDHLNMSQLRIKSYSK